MILHRGLEGGREFPGSGCEFRDIWITTASVNIER